MSIPTDFAERAAQCSNNELMEHYGAALRTISRWRRISGVWSPRLHERPARPAIVQSDAAPVRKRVAPAARRIKSARRFCERIANHDGSRAAQAAEYLKRYGPVFRCDANGNFLLDGFFWRRGRAVLSAEEIVQRAEALGWNPDAWRQLGAAA